MYKNAIKYLESIDDNETVVIVTHWDMDGSSSAAIISLILEELRGRGADDVRIPDGRRHRIGPSTENRLREGAERLIVLDMSVPAERVSQISGDYGTNILIIDHHDFDTVPDDAVFVNPRETDPNAYVPAAKLCNDISSNFGLDTDWIAGLGIIQDFGAEKVMGLFERLKKIHPDYFPNRLSQESLAKHCRYGRISSVMNVKPYKDTQYCSKLAFRTLTEAKDLSYVEAHEAYQELQAYHAEVSEEIEQIRDSFDSEKEVFPDKKLVFFRFSSPHHINSSIATQVSLQHEDWIYVLAKVDEDSVNVSSRCQSGRVDLGSLMRRALPDDAAPSEAGGHNRAAGASFPPNFLKTFKKNLLEVAPSTGSDKNP